MEHHGGQCVMTSSGHLMPVLCADNSAYQQEVCIAKLYINFCCDSYYHWTKIECLIATFSYFPLPLESGAIPLTDVDPGGGSIVLDDVACVGTELRLTSCPHSTNPNCRTHDDDVGVRCQEAGQSSN